MGQVRFRQADPSDAIAVLELKQAAIDGIDAERYSNTQLSAWRPDDDALPAFEGAIKSDRFDILLAEHHGRLVGYGVLNVPDNRIDAVFVHPDRAREGIASSLVGQLEMRAQMHDVSELKIVASLNAKPLYASLGYWEFGTEVRTIDGIDIEFAIMRKPLDSGWSR